MSAPEVVLRIEDKKIQDGCEHAKVWKFSIKPFYNAKQKKKVWDQFKSKAREIAGTEESWP